MKYIIMILTLLGIIATPTFAQMTPEDFDQVREIVDIYVDTILFRINFVTAFQIATLILIIFAIYLPNIADMYKTRKEYDYKKLENRVQTLEQETDKETQ